jgi:hypothetical protein
MDESEGEWMTPNAKGKIQQKKAEIQEEKPKSQGPTLGRLILNNHMLRN